MGRSGGRVNEPNLSPSLYMLVAETEAAGGSGVKLLDREDDGANVISSGRVRRAPAAAWSATVPGAGARGAMGRRCAAGAGQPDADDMRLG